MKKIQTNIVLLYSLFYIPNLYCFIRLLFTLFNDNNYTPDMITFVKVKYFISLFVHFIYFLIKINNLSLNLLLIFSFFFIPKMYFHPIIQFFILFFHYTIHIATSHSNFLCSFITLLSIIHLLILSLFILSTFLSQNKVRGAPSPPLVTSSSPLGRTRRV